MFSSLIYATLLLCLAVPHAWSTDIEERPRPTLPGTCPDFPPMESLDSQKLNGDWFAVYGAKGGFVWNRTPKCIKKTFTAQPNGGFEVFMTRIRDDEVKSKTITATPIGGKNSKLNVRRVPEDASKIRNKTKTITILGTNYDGYLVTVFCKTNGTTHNYFVHVYSRKTTLDAAEHETVNDLLQAKNIDDELMPIEGC